jgi:hypothetical protein
MATTEVTIEEETPTISRKRKVADAVTTTSVTIALSLVAQVLIQKVVTKVHTTIVPEDATNNE